MTRSLDERLDRIERVQDSLATNQIAERKGDHFYTSDTFQDKAKAKGENDQNHR
jgi:hypothetical protein